MLFLRKANATKSWDIVGIWVSFQLDQTIRRCISHWQWTQFICAVAVPEENVASLKHGAQVLKGEMRQALLDGDHQNYDVERGFTRHIIDEQGESGGIVIKLRQQCILNYIRMLLWDRDLRYFTRYVIKLTPAEWTEAFLRSSLQLKVLLVLHWCFNGPRRLGSSCGPYQIPLQILAKYLLPSQGGQVRD